MTTKLDQQAMKQESQRLLQGAPIPWSRWTHYKGGEYEVIAAGIKENTHNAMVVYWRPEEGIIWIRDLGSFLGEVPGPDLQPVRRFVQNPRRVPTCLQ